MKVSLLRDMTREELVQKRRELQDEQFNMKMRRTLKPLDNPLLLREMRRDLARIATLLNEDTRGIRVIVDRPVDVLAQKKAVEKK
ncbi:MAG: 50S ribosomal protein L29 [Candidatus Zixiibacteriota bacterium]